MDERKLILRIVKIMPDDIVLMSESERLDVLIDIGEKERGQLIEFCSRIIVTAADGKRIKMQQLEARYADQLINKS
jgi:hypothetical protein